MKKISQDALKEIKKQKIVPTPKWQFSIRNYFLWILLALFILIGSLSFSILLLAILTNDWDIYHYLGQSFWSYLIYTLPSLWILLLIIFVILAYYDFRHTRLGYRYKSFWIIGGSILISLILGLIFCFAGVSGKIDQYLTKSIPYYQNISGHREQVWLNPDKGLLAGEIVAVNNEDFTLKDFSNHMWQVNIQDATFKGRTSLINGMQIKIIGQKIDDNNFKAAEIRLWGSGQGQGRGWRGGNGH